MFCVLFIINKFKIRPRFDSARFRWWSETKILLASIHLFGTSIADFLGRIGDQNATQIISVGLFSFPFRNGHFTECIGLEHVECQPGF